MKKLLLFLLIAANISLVQAQEYDTIPPYQKDSLHIPKFTVLKTDSSYTNDMAIPEGKPVVIVYFSPTCGHCQLAADEFNLQQFTNSIIGRDPNYAIPSYFRVKFTPYMAVYNKDHHLIQTYGQGTEADTIMALLKKSN